MRSSDPAMRSSNPALSDRVLDGLSIGGEQSSTMTVNGMAVKTAVALLGVFLSAGIAWIQFSQGAAMGPYIFGGMIIGFIAAIATMFRPQWAAFTTPIYALAEGAALGGLSAMIASQFPEVSIVPQACALTFGTLFVMLICYQTGFIRVTETLRSCIVAATGAIALLYMVSFVLGIFWQPIGFIHSSGPIGIGFSLFVVGLAAFNLLLDFDLVDRLVAQRAPKYMEWYAAFALLTTLVWLYLEILRLLSKLQSRD